ncbi:TIGR04086 family membrane protein, partial [Dysosmobacter welbionis]
MAAIVTVLLLDDLDTAGHTLALGGQLFPGLGDSNFTHLGQDVIRQRRQLSVAALDSVSNTFLRTNHMGLADDADVGQPDGLVHDAPQVLRELVQAVLIHHGGHLAEAHGGAEGVLRHLADVVGVTQRGPSIQSAVNGAQLQ